MNHKSLFFCIVLVLGSCAPKEKYKLAPGIYILDKNEPIVSLEDLTSKFRGKPIYIDRWASWCNPCVEEFKHSESLHRYLDEQSIEMVYLNSDADLEESAWFDFIIKHKLRGYHLRLDSLLKADLVDKEVFIPMIPQYILMNAEGVVLTNQANKPSDSLTLHRQIDSLLGK